MSFIRNLITSKKWIPKCSFSNTSHNLNYKQGSTFSSKLKSISLFSQKRNFVAWKQYILNGTGENIEESLDSIQKEWATLENNQNEEIDFAFLLLSKNYSANILNNVSSYVKNKLNIKHLAGGVVDGVWAPSETKHISNVNEPKNKDLGIFLMLGKKNCDIENKEIDYNVTSFHIHSPELYKHFKNSVGKWKTYDSEDKPERSSQSSKFNDNFNPDKFKSISQSTNTIECKNEIFNMADNPSGLFLFVAHRECQKYLEELDRKFPKALKFGLIAASTPFVNEKEATLYHSSKLCSEGIVGLYISPTKNATVEMKYPSLEILGNPFPISRCQGNIILELEGHNATRQLLNLVQGDSGKAITKETEVYARVESDNTILNKQILRVGSGDPSKGAMSLETTFDLQPGDKIQFLYRPIVSTLPSFPFNGITLCCASEESVKPEGNICPLIFSENGILIGSSAQASQVITLKGAYVNLV